MKKYENDIRAQVSSPKVLYSQAVIIMEQKIKKRNLKF